MVHLSEDILLLCGDCGMVISPMLNVAIIIIILTINRKDSEHAMPSVPKRRRPPRFISINVIYRIMTSACQYVECHIQTMKTTKKHYNNNKFKRNDKIVRRVRWDRQWLHCHMHSMTTSLDRGLKRTTFDTDSSPSCSMMGHLHPSPMIWGILYQPQQVFNVT